MNDQLLTAVQNMKSSITGPDAGKIKAAAFESALIGIRKGTMTYESDPMIPILIKEIEAIETKAKTMTDPELTKIVQIKPD
jgi:hypothetical protein